MRLFAKKWFVIGHRANLNGWQAIEKRTYFGRPFFLYVSPMFVCLGPYTKDKAMKIGRRLTAYNRTQLLRFFRERILAMAEPKAKIPS